jgi:hypothetical protein
VCRKGYFKKLNKTTKAITCEKECGDYLYEDAETLTCESCMPNCETCSNKDVCERCELRYYLCNGKCSYFPVEGFYLDDDTRSCLKC